MAGSARGSEDPSLRPNGEPVYAVADLIEDGILFLDPSLRVAHCNHALARLLQRTDELVGAPCPPELLGSGGPDGECAAARAMREGRHAKWEASVAGRWYSVAADPIRGADGSVKALVCRFFDDTTRREAEEALRASEEQIRAFFNHAPAIVWVKDLDGRFLRVNRYACSALGLPEEVILGRTVAELFPGSEADAFAANDLEVLRSGEHREFLESAELADGLHEFLSVKFPVRDAEGRTEGIGAICTDITDRARMERERETSARALATLTGPGEMPQLVREALQLVSAGLRYDCVSVRLRETDGWPHLQAGSLTSGAPCAADDGCLHGTDACPRQAGGSACPCGLVLEGRTDPRSPHFTEHGSFWTNRASATPELPTAAGDARSGCDGCVRRGYESVGLFPLRVSGEVFGLLQVCDRSPDRLPPSSVPFFERLADGVAIALAHRRSEDERAVSERRLRAFLDNAPAIVWVKDLEGRFVAVNRYTCEVHGVDAGALIGRTVADIHTPAEASQYTANDRAMLESGGPREFLEPLEMADGTHTMLAVKFPVCDAAGQVEGIGAICTDVTDHVRVQVELETQAHVLGLLTGQGDLHELMGGGLRAIREAFGYDAVGLRLEDGGDYPYFESSGLPLDLVQEEFSLCKRDADGCSVLSADGGLELECMCGHVLEGRTSAGKPYFTERGSFFTNDATTFAEVAAPEDLSPPHRGKCVRAGFRSIGLFPLRIGGTTFGLLQVDDRRPGRFTPPSVAFLERLADSMAIVVAHRRGMDELRESEERLRLFIEHAPASLAMFDREMRYIAASRRWLTDYHLGGIDVTGRSHYEVFPEIGEEWRAVHQRGLRGEVVGADEDRFERQDGSVQWLHWEVRPWHRVDGAIGGIVIFSEDITERKLAADALRESEQRLRLFIEHAPASLAMFDRDMRYLAASRRWHADFGLGQGDLVGRLHYDIFPELDERLRAAHRRGLAGEVVWADEDLFTRPDGTAQWLCWEVRPWHRADGATGGIIIIAEDITGRREAAEALRESEQRYRALADNVPVSIFIKDRESVFVSCNAAFALALGIAPERIAGTTDLDYYPPAIAEQYRADDRRLMEAARIETIEEPSIVEGAEVWVRTLKAPVFDAAGNVVGIVGILGDITEERRAADELRASEARYRALVDNIPQSVFIKDRESTYVSCNAAYARLLGIAPEAIAGTTDYDYFPTELAERYRGDDRRLMEVGATERIEEPIIVGGASIVIETIKTPVRDSQGEIVGILGIFRDITEERRAADALRASEERHRILFESSRDALIVTAYPNPAAVTANPAAVALFGAKSVDELLGHSTMGLSPETQPDGVSSIERGRAMAAIAMRKGSHEFEWVHRRFTGEDFPAMVLLARFEVSGRTMLLVTVRDVGELHAKEQQLLQAQRLEAVGRLAGGVAHDFNNLLAVVLGYAELALDQLRADDPVHGCVTQIQQAGERGAALTRQLLAFSRKQVLEPRVLDLNEVVQHIQRMLERLLGEDVRIGTGLAPDLGRVYADPSQVEQIIVNLCVNSRDAMPDGGQLTIETGNVYLDEDYAASRIGVTPGPYVLLSISDTGHGMDVETRTRIFEPFFTTKEKGKGTGLGLATVYGIVKQSGGTISVYSEVGGGTAFRVDLPRTDAPAEELARATQAPARGAGETVLLVEDEDQLRVVSEVQLRRVGYRVLSAANGGEALLRCEQHPGPIDLLLTDVVMPGMSGRELSERLATIRPGLRTLYMSGYTDNAIVHHGVLDHGTHFIAKPFSGSELARKVREVLDG